MLKSISLTAGGGGVSRRKRFGPDVYSWPWINNTALQLALSEAAATGLVLGMGAPGVEENWLRGVRQGPLATGVTGATYARSGTRAGLDPANLFFDNLIRASEAFNNAVWGKSASGVASIPVVTADAGIAPDGTTTADRIVIALNGGTTTGDFSSLPQTVTVSSGVAYTFTIYLKSNTASSYAMLILGVTGTQFPITVTPTWQRFQVVQTSATTSVSPQLRLRGGQTPTNSDSVDILAWGAQLVQGNVPGPYIPNPSTTLSASQVRREAGRGVRVFGAGTNLIYASEAFDNAVWTKVDATVTANAGVAPNGTMTADKLVESTSSSPHSIRSTSFGSGTITNGVNYAYSVYLKAAERSWAVLELEGSFGGGFAWFNLANGTIGTQTGLVSASIFSVGNGWYRCTIIDLSTGTGGVTTRCNLFTAPLNDIINYLGDGTSGILVWGAQLEQSSFATDYIPNASTTVSASAGADNLQIAASSLPASGPIVFIADIPAQAIVGTIPRVFEWNGLITLQNNSTSSIYSTSDGSANGPAQSGLTVNGARRIAMLYTPGAATRLSVNGSAVAVGTDVGVAVPTAVNYIGNRAALDRPLNGSIGIFAAYPGNPSDAQLQAMSAL